MGGNVTAVNKKTGKAIDAVKIPVKEIGRQDFIDTFIKIFKKMNSDFYTKFKKKIWVDESHLISGFAFNGSTSFIMDPTLSDEEVIKYKPSAGDLDVVVPEELKEELWKYLDSIEGEEIIPGAVYHGSNRPTLSSVTDQINSVIIVEFKNSVRAYCQVDFELLPFENNKPTDWSKFSHSSSFEDAKASIKAVHHKYAIRALVGGASVRDDIVIATKSSTPDKIKLSGAKADQLPRMLKFSVLRGIGIAYEPMLDENGKEIKLDGKYVYKEIPTSERKYETIISEIYKLSFRQLDGHEDDVKMFYSYVGILQLMKKFLTEVEIKRTHNRYLDMLWGCGTEKGQVLETSSRELDFEVKNAGYQKFIKTFGLKDESKTLIDKYYKEVFKDKIVNESKTFRSLIQNLKNGVRHDI